MRSVKNKATLSHVLPDVVTIYTGSDTGVLRGLKSLAQEKI
jgi:hypothetical protein